MHGQKNIKLLKILFTENAVLSENKDKTQNIFKLHQLVHRVTSRLKNFNISRTYTVYCQDIW
jgi:hypothetical protein